MKRISIVLGICLATTAVADGGVEYPESHSIQINDKTYRPVPDEVLEAEAQGRPDNLYFASTGGGAFPEDSDSETGWATSAAIGYQRDLWRGELNIGYSEFDRKTPIPIPTPTPRHPSQTKGEASAATIMVNGYRDFLPHAIIHPYIGAGLGVAVIKHETGLRENEDAAFALNLMGGIAYPLTDWVSTTLGYRYLYTPSIGKGIDAESHETNVGLRFKF